MNAPHAPRSAAQPPAPGLRALTTLALLALVLLRGNSCARVNRPYPPPTAKQVVATLGKRAQAVRTVRAETRMAHQTKQGKVKATVRLMAQLGGKLRFDAVTPFDTPLSTLVANGRDFALLDAKANRHYFGPASPCNLARLLRVRLAPDDVLAVLGGTTPLIPHAKATIRWDGRAGEEVLTLTGKDGRRQVVRLLGRSKGGRTRWDLVSSEIRDGGGKVLMTLRAGKHGTIAGLRVPRTLSIKQPRYAAELDIAFKKHELNIKLPAAAFTLPSARGMPSQRVDCSSLGAPPPPKAPPAPTTAAPKPSVPKPGSAPASRPATK